MQPAEVYGEALKQYGINFYLSKTTGEEEMLQLLKHFIQNEIAARNTISIEYKSNPFATLSPRELELLHYVIKGFWHQKNWRDP